MNKKKEKLQSKTVVEKKMGSIILLDFSSSFLFEKNSLQIDPDL